MSPKRSSDGGQNFERRASKFEVRSLVLHPVVVDGHRLECHWIGPPPDAAPSLIFLHEGLGSARRWRDFPDALCRRTRCGGLVYSRWGYGQSDPVEEPRSVRFMHDEALRVLPRLLESFSVGRHILIGHSDGGSIAIIHAGSRPATLAGIVLEAAHVFVEDVTTSTIRDARTRYARTELKSKLARYHDHVDRMFESWTDVWLSPAFRAWTIEEYLPAIRCPALIIQGEDDEYGTLKQVEAIESGIGGDHERLILPACGHAPHIDQRTAVEDAMASFITRALSGSEVGTTPRPPI